MHRYGYNHWGAGGVGGGVTCAARRTIILYLLSLTKLQLLIVCIFLFNGNYSFALIFVH